MAPKSETSHIVMRSSSSSTDYSKNEKVIVEQIDTLPSQDIEPANVDEDEQPTGVPPADGGRGAWMFLAGCFVFEALVWGDCFLVS